VPDFVAPMKAMLVNSMRPGDWLYEIKFDGYRALALCGGNETRILSRNEKDLGRQFPDVKDAVAALKVEDCIIDGEIVALDDKGRSSFQLIASARRRSCKAAHRFLRLRSSQA
jgi:bifunctional non-homologous end joining protein LigD